MPNRLNPKFIKSSWGQVRLQTVLTSQESCSLQQFHFHQNFMGWKANQKADTQDRYSYWQHICHNRIWYFCCTFPCLECTWLLSGKEKTCGVEKISWWCLLTKSAWVLSTKGKSDAELGLLYSTAVKQINFLILRNI